MYLKTKYRIEGSRLSIIARTDTENRLSTTCFRGDVKKSGNIFIPTQSVEDLLRYQDEKAIKAIVASAADFWKDEDGYTHFTTVEFEDFVGYSSTAEIKGFNENELESFKPNRKSTGLKVRLPSDKKCPKTKLVTFIYEMRLEQDGFKIVIHSIYPGKYIGPLKGNISQREQIVFFDWEHPGEE